MVEVQGNDAGSIPVVRRRGYEEGEELDLNAAVRAMIDIRRGVMPDPRINIRITRHVRDLAVLILLDLSESTNERVNKDDESSPSILTLTREATACWPGPSTPSATPSPSMASPPMAATTSNTSASRTSASPTTTCPSAPGGMKGGLSTRMGAALRHAGHHLRQQPAQKRLVLLITDGEPADIDERDPQYLRHDAKKAVEDLAMQGIYTYCLTLDPLADRYVARIFGENRYAIVDHVERLPERLPAVFATITG